MSSPTATLGTFAADLELERVPQAVRRHARLSLLDTLGCALFGATLPWSRTLQELVAEEGGEPDAAVWGTAARTSRSQAALVNGSAAHGFEIDDLHMGGMVHLGAVGVPAALAVGERAGVSGATFLAALIAGYEIGARVGIAVGTPHFKAGFHPQGTVGAFAAAAAAGRALGLGAGELQHALAIAGSQAAGLMSAQEGAMVKRMHSGRAAQSGVYGALLAARGFSGAPNVLEAPFGGFLSTMGDGRARPEQLTAGLGETWETAAIGFKRHASCAAAHTSLDVASDLRGGIAAADDVVAVRIETSRHTWLHCGWEYHPSGVTAAQMSIPYGVARMLLDGRVSAEQFTEDAIRDPAVLALVRRIHVLPVEAIDALGPDLRHTVRLEMRLTDGRTLMGEATHRRGSAADPLPEHEVRAKFDELAGHAIGAEGAARLAAAVDDIETADGLADLLAPLETTANATETAR